VLLSNINLTLNVILGFHGDEYVVYSLLGCGNMSSR
jgi:hypothetical protein